MSENEFKEKMLKNGWDNEFIDEIINDRDRAKANNEPCLPLETYLDMYGFKVCD